MTHGALSRRSGRTMSVAAVIAGALATSAWMALQPAPVVDAGGAAAAAPGRHPPFAAPQAAVPAPMAVPVPATAAPTPAPAPVRSVADALPRPQATAEPAYRYMGRTGSGEDAAIVLFGRGRIVSVRGPMPLDDEHDVEAVFDDYLVLRHRPTANGSFIRLDRLQPAAAPRNPEDSLRD